MTGKKHNQGFSLIELLIAVAILSIIMIAVVQFMSTTSGAYQKNKKNLNLQTDTMQIMGQLSDTIMRANYIRLETKDKGMYTIVNSDKETKNKRSVEQAKRIKTKADGSTESELVGNVTYDFVPDNYPNYSKNCYFGDGNPVQAVDLVDGSPLVDGDGNPILIDEESRKIIVDYDSFKLYAEKADASKNPIAYPLDGSGGTSTDADYIAGVDVRSFRALRTSTDYMYVKPEFLYIEYPEMVSGTQKTVHVCYYFTNIVDVEDQTCAIYMARKTSDKADALKYNFAAMKKLILDSIKATGSVSDIDVSRQDVCLDAISGEVVYTKFCDTVSGRSDDLAGSKEGVRSFLKALKEPSSDCGFVTEKISDFYISADSDGNAILLDSVFKDGSYEYHIANTVVCRNTEVLTVRPQRLLRYKEATTEAATTEATTP